MFFLGRMASGVVCGIDDGGTMITHEAHHRGHVCMLANQLGIKLPGAVISAMWRWEGLATNR